MDPSPLSDSHIKTWTLPEGNREKVRARLEQMRTDDLGKLRRVLRSLVTVELLPWEGSGKPTVQTARQRVKISEANPEAA